MRLITIAILCMALTHRAVSLTLEELKNVRQVATQAATQAAIKAATQTASDVCMSDTKRLEEKVALLEDTVMKQQSLMKKQQRDYRAFGGLNSGVAFSAILQHNLDNLGDEQTLIFDDVLVNDGQGYNRQTGAFIAPTQGVYMFVFFIGQRGHNQIFVHLTKNGQAIVEAGSEGLNDSHDTQGGNAAILPLVAGDVVAVRHHVWGAHIESSTPLTTFSGFLLYDTEGSVIVG
uniref:C1q n=1 Tax=Sinonovacula constricta TaxID=98310 RepID=A0A4P8DYJ0_SINCO|nr:C1q [Sinonovacula constricta]